MGDVDLGGSSQLVVAVIASAARVDDRLNRRVSRGVFAVALSAILFLFSGCGDDGVIARFMLKPERIIVDGIPRPSMISSFPIMWSFVPRANFAPS